MFKQKIEKGIKFLDQNYPDWLDKIDVSELNLNDCHQCVMGQLLGNYIFARKKHGINTLHKLGFNITDRYPNHLQLTKEWKETIKNKKQNQLQ